MNAFSSGKADNEHFKITDTWTDHVSHPKLEYEEKKYLNQSI